jgi:hypothetical protein
MQWMWLLGSSDGSDPVQYPVKGVPTTAAMFGRRTEFGMALSSSGQALYIFGGSLPNGMSTLNA